MNTSMPRGALPTQAIPAAETLVGPRLVHAHWDDIWIAGDPTALRPPLVGIVGTRRPDVHGRRMAWEIANELGTAGICVLSGGALGIDAAAHVGALEARARTVVVLPSGFSHPYPQRHEPMYERVLATGGALVSPFHPDTPPARWTFAKRNGLVAALCDVLLVVQAPAASGSLLTAEAAHALGRRIFVVPASPGDVRAEGCLRLLRGGAEVCTSAADLVRAVQSDGPLFERTRTRKRSSTDRQSDAPAQASRARHARARVIREPMATTSPLGDQWSLDEYARLVYDSLSSSLPKHVDEIAHETQLDVVRVRACVLTLVLAGLVIDHNNGTLSRDAAAG